MSASKRKKERRRMRYEKHVRAEIEHKKQAWEDGKLIEENHNDGPYSEEYTLAVSERLYKYVGQERDRADAVERGELEYISKRTGLPYTPQEVYVWGFRKYKMKVQDMILHWNPGVPKNHYYDFLKLTLEVYWDEVKQNQNLQALREVPY